MTRHFKIDEREIILKYIRSPGPGGQNVNKVATAVQLRFNIFNSSSLSEEIRQRLIVLLGKKLTTQGDLIISAHRYRTQERNREDALSRLREIVLRAMNPPRKRKPTKPTRASKEERLEKKKKHSRVKNLRSKKLFLQGN
jgi:ribosome-associated protein